MARQIQHEAEMSRQHARYRLPADLVIGGQRYALKDWSVGGVTATGIGPEIGQQEELEGHLAFDLSGFSLSMAVRIEILRYDAEEQTIGGRFCDLGRQDVSLLHYIINAYLAGELVDAGDILAVAARNNFVERDLDTELYEVDRTPAKPLFRYGGNVLLFVVLAVLLGFVAHTLYQRWFVVESLWAQVNGPQILLRAPTDGYLGLTEEAAADSAKAGSLVAVIENLDGSASTLESPCDCRIVELLADDGVYLQRGEAVLALMKQGAALTLEARIAVESLDQVQIGDRASARFTGGGGAATGRVAKIRPPNSSPVEGATSQALLIIEPDQPLPPERLGELATVRIETLRH